MRILIKILACACVGVVVGGAVGWREFSGTGESFDPNRKDTGTAVAMSEIARKEGAALPPDQGVKVLVVNGESHDFGSTEKGQTGQHDFLFRNEGTSTLRIASGGTSCSACTVSSLTKTTIEPGETAPVTVQWTPSTNDSEFRKEAYILTNDAQHPTVVLVVKGKVIDPVKVSPTEITLGSVTASSELKAEAKLLRSLGDDFSIVSHSLSNTDSLDHFDVSIEPLTEEEAKSESVLSGYRIAVKVKPGLPLGPIIQTITLHTNRPGNQKFEVPIRGHVVSDISILANRMFDSKNNILSLGIVQQDAGKKVTLPILIKGPHRDTIELSVGEITPAANIQATLGEPKSINECAVRMVPLQIEGVKGGPLVSWTGGADPKEYGRIVIKTTHPEAKELQVLVRFAVE